MTNEAAGGGGCALDLDTNARVAVDLVQVVIVQLHPPLVRLAQILLPVTLGGRSIGGRSGRVLNGKSLVLLQSLGTSLVLLQSLGVRGFVQFVRVDGIAHLGPDKSSSALFHVQLQNRLS